jgi:hypothetical protein
MPTVRPHGTYQIQFLKGANSSELERSHRPHTLLKATPAKLARNHLGSHSYSHSLSEVNPSVTEIPLLHSPEETGSVWLGVPLKFDVLEEEVEIEGYQMYAVEKWYVCIIPS